MKKLDLIIILLFLIGILVYGYSLLPYSHYLSDQSISNTCSIDYTYQFYSHNPKGLIMTEAKKVWLVRDNDGDWVELYINGKWIASGHHISDDELCKYLGIECVTKWMNLEDIDLPTTLTEEEFNNLG